MNGYVVRDLPWAEEELRKIPPFEFENWAGIALGGTPNKTEVGDMGIDVFFRKSGKSIVALTVREILDEEIARKLA